MEEFNLDEEIDKNDELNEKSNEKKSLITFAKLNKFFLIPILCAIFGFLNYLFEIIIDETEVIKRQEFIKSICYELPYVLAGLFYFISYFKSNAKRKNKSNNNKESDTGINYIYNENLPTIYNSKKIIMIILLLGVMNSIDDLLWVFTNYANIFEERLIYLFFIPLFLKLY